MKILVTGSNGYLGQGIVRHLLGCGADVVATGRRLDRVDEAGVRRYKQSQKRHSEYPDEADQRLH